MPQKKGSSEEKIFANAPSREPPLLRAHGIDDPIRR